MNSFFKKLVSLLVAESFLFTSILPAWASPPSYSHLRPSASDGANRRDLLQDLQDNTDLEAKKDLFALDGANKTLDEIFRDVWQLSKLRENFENVYSQNPKAFEKIPIVFDRGEKGSEVGYILFLKTLPADLHQRSFLARYLLTSINNDALSRGAEKILLRNDMKEFIESAIVEEIVGNAAGQETMDVKENYRKILQEKVKREWTPQQRTVTEAWLDLSIKVIVGGKERFRNLEWFLYEGTSLSTPTEGKTIEEFPLLAIYNQIRFLLSQATQRGYHNIFFGLTPEELKRRVKMASQQKKRISNGTIQVMPFNYKEGNYIGIDIGGNFIKSVIVQNGETVNGSQISVDTPGKKGGKGTRDDVLRKVKAILRLQSWRLKRQKTVLHGIGIGVPGVVWNRQVFLGLGTEMKEANQRNYQMIQQWVSKVFPGVEVVIGNDGDVEGFGYLTVEERTNAIFLKLGTSIAGAYVNHAGLLDGINEVGRIVVDLGKQAEPHRKTGVKGASRMYISAFEGMGRMLKEKGLGEKGEEINSLLKGEQGEEKQREAEEILETVSDHLAEAILELYRIYRMDKVYLSGGGTRDKTGEVLLKYTRPKLQRIFKELGETPPLLERPKEQEYGGAYGAALLSSQRRQHKLLIRRLAEEELLAKEDRTLEFYQRRGDKEAAKAVDTFLDSVSILVERAEVPWPGEEGFRRYLTEHFGAQKIIIAAGRGSRFSPTGLRPKQLALPDGFTPNIKWARSAASFGKSKDIIVVDPEVAYHLLKDAKIEDDVRTEILAHIEKEFNGWIGILQEELQPERRRMLEEKKEGLKETILGIVRRSLSRAYHPNQKKDVAETLRRIRKEIGDVLNDVVTEKERAVGLANTLFDEISYVIVKPLIGEGRYIDEEKQNELLGGESVVSLARPYGPGEALREGLETWNILVEKGELPKSGFVMPVYSDYSRAILEKFPNIYFITYLQALSLNNPAVDQLPLITVTGKYAEKVDRKGSIFIEKESEVLYQRILELIRKRSEMTDEEKELLYQIIPTSITEWRKMNDEEKKLAEEQQLVNAGVFVIDGDWALSAAGRLRKEERRNNPDPEKGKVFEFFYTDFVNMAAEDEGKEKKEDPDLRPKRKLVFFGEETPAGIKDLRDLVKFRRELDEEMIDKLRQLGIVVKIGTRVSLSSPLGDRDIEIDLKRIFKDAIGQEEKTVLRGDIHLENTVRIAKGVHLEGNIELRGDTSVGEGVRLKNVTAQDTTFVENPLTGLSEEAKAGVKRFIEEREKKYGEFTAVDSTFEGSYVEGLARILDSVVVESFISGVVVRSRTRRDVIVEDEELWDRDEADRIRQLSPYLFDPAQYVPGVYRLGEKGKEDRDGIKDYIRENLYTRREKVRSAFEVIYFGLYERTIPDSGDLERIVQETEAFLDHPITKVLTSDQLWRYAFAKIRAYSKRVPRTFSKEWKAFEGLKERRAELIDSIQGVLTQFYDQWDYIRLWDWNVREGALLNARSDASRKLFYKRRALAQSVSGFEYGTLIITESSERSMMQPLQEAMHRELKRAVPLDEVKIELDRIARASAETIVQDLFDSIETYLEETAKDPFWIEKRQVKSPLRRFVQSRYLTSSDGGIRSSIERMKSGDVDGEMEAKKLFRRLVLLSVQANLFDLSSVSKEAFQGKDLTEEELERIFDDAVTDLSQEFQGNINELEKRVFDGKKGHFLYLVDNTGELEVDSALWYFLALMGHKVTVVTKKLPAWADATFDDVKDVLRSNEFLSNLHEEGKIEVVTTGETNTFGILLDRVGDDFRMAFTSPTLHYFPLHFQEAKTAIKFAPGRVRQRHVGDLSGYQQVTEEEIRSLGLNLHFGLWTRLFVKARDKKEALVQIFGSDINGRRVTDQIHLSGDIYIDENVRIENGVHLGPWPRGEDYKQRIVLRGNTHVGKGVKLERIEASDTVFEGDPEFDSFSRVSAAISDAEIRNSHIHHGARISGQQRRSVIEDSEVRGTVTDSVVRSSNVIGVVKNSEIKNVDIREQDVVENETRASSETFRTRSLGEHSWSALEKVTEDIQKNFSEYGIRFEGRIAKYIETLKKKRELFVGDLIGIYKIVEDEVRNSPDDDIKSRFKASVHEEQERSIQRFGLYLLGKIDEALKNKKRADARALFRKIVFLTLAQDKLLDWSSNRTREVIGEELFLADLDPEFEKETLDTLEDRAFNGPKDHPFLYVTDRERRNEIDAALWYFLGGLGHRVGVVESDRFEEEKWAQETEALINDVPHLTHLRQEGSLAVILGGEASHAFLSADPVEEEEGFSKRPQFRVVISKGQGNLSSLARNRIKAEVWALLLSKGGVWALLLGRPKRERGEKYEPIIKRIPEGTQLVTPQKLQSLLKESPPEKTAKDGGIGKEISEEFQAKAAKDGGEKIDYRLRTIDHRLPGAYRQEIQRPSIELEPLLTSP